MKSKTILIGVIGIFIGLALGFGTSQIFAYVNNPISKPLEIETEEPTMAVQKEIAGEAPTEAPAAEMATPEPVGYCGRTGSMVVLLTGADTSPDLPPAGADAIRMMLLDFDTPSAVLLDIPRDLVVQVNGIAPENQGTQPIGLAYHYEMEAFEGTQSEKVEIATNFLAQTIFDNLGVISQYYITIQMDNFPDMVDAIGGVTITLPEEITTSFGTTYPAGTQVLNGQQASEFLRTDQPGGVEAREERQNLFLDALKSQVISFNIIDNVPDLIDEFSETITTDLSPALMVDMACLVNKIGNDNLQYVSFPDNVLSTVEDQLVVSNPLGLMNFIEELFEK